MEIGCVNPVLDAVRDGVDIHNFAFFKHWYFLTALISFYLLLDFLRFFCAPLLYASILTGSTCNLASVELSISWMKPQGPHYELVLASSNNGAKPARYDAAFTCTGPLSLVRIILRPFRVNKTVHDSNQQIESIRRSSAAYILKNKLNAMQISASICQA